MTKALAPIKLNIIRFIHLNSVVHYADIESHFGISRKTVQKYLDYVDEVAADTKVKLVRKQNVGIYFEGPVETLIEKLQTNSAARQLPNNKDERVIYLLSRLLMESQPLTIQKFADELFVSRTTLEGDVKEARTYLNKHEVEIIRSHQGLSIDVSEEKRRKLMADLLIEFWGKGTFLVKSGSELKRHLRISGDLHSIFDDRLSDQVITAVNSFERRSGLTLTDYEFESLVVHLVIAIKRIQDGKSLPDLSEGADKLENNTQLLVQILEESFQTKLPVLEQRYLNIHVLAIEGKEQKESIPEQEALDSFLGAELGSEGSYDTKLISGLSLHLQPALSRASYGLSIANPYTAEIKKMYPEAFERAVHLSAAITDKYSVKLNEDETAYIALHIQSYFERKRNRQKMRVVVVCSTGMGTSRFLEQQLITKFGSKVEIVDVMSVSEFMTSQPDVDLIISTIPIRNTKGPVVVVSPFLNESDMHHITAGYQDFQSSNIDNSAFMSLLDRHLVQINDRPQTRDEVLQQMTSELQHQGFASKGIYESALEREEMSTTAFQLIATPHANPNFVLTPKISVLINPKGIQWAGQNVFVVYFIALNTTVKGQLNEIYMYFNEIVHSNVIVKRLKTASDAAQVIKILGGGV